MNSPNDPVFNRRAHALSGRGCNDCDRSLPYEATIADARAEILKEVGEGNTRTSAVTVALADDQHILWSEAFGSIDRSLSIAPTTETLFCIASCSKVIAAVAVMILVDRGVIELDAPVVRYLPDFRMADGESYRDITVRMLLNHSSGLHGTHFRNILTIVPVFGYAAHFQDALAAERLKHPPGEMAVYCSDGFTLIELVVAAVTGQAYTQFVQKEILEPLGMNHSRFTLEEFESGSFAPGLDAEGRPEPQEYVNTYASGLFSTASDMGRLAMMFLNGGRLGDTRILSVEAIAEMGRDQTLNLPLNPITDHPVHFGLGWDGVRQGGLDAVGVTAWYKAGDADHYHSFFIVAPGERLAVAVLLTNDVGIGSVAGLLAERILLNALAERGSIAKFPSPPEAAAPPAVPSTAEDLDAIAGIYVSSYGPRRLDPMPDGTLTLSNFVSGEWQPSIEGFRLRQDGCFVPDDHPEIAYRLVVAAGRRYLAARRPGGLGHYDMEFPDSHDLPPQPLSARWQSRVGRRWLVVDDPFSAFLALRRQSPLFSLVQVEGLDGYLAASLTSAGFDLVQVVDPVESDDRARMCLKIPIDNGWGLNDLVIEVRDGEEWVRWGSIRYRPVATVPALERTGGTVTVGHEGLGEWRRLPAASSITYEGATVWYLYNSAFALMKWGLGKGAVGKVDAGTYLLLHGAPDTTITLTVEP
ncbi:beta-lactamase family protein [Geomonas sp. RF6]|uniref:serine hydrolase domain-containing protein n=1 Tax=Geomonas sp. RF6 TaxID=2897342 RepID=UPI001E4192E8|nr:serine hydrolase domain-containing protein [Geomonas sp. RF6]UFS70247.1 beta-lactamase family protein [Geomonas sp. RF6]